MYLLEVLIINNSFEPDGVFEIKEEKKGMKNTQIIIININIKQKTFLIKNTSKKRV